MPSPIPHDWTPAPCLDLVNSRWSDHLGSGRSYDRLPEPLFRRAFLKRWGYRVGDPDSAGGIACWTTMALSELDFGPFAAGASTDGAAIGVAAVMTVAG